MRGTRGEANGRKGGLSVLGDPPTLFPARLFCCVAFLPVGRCLSPPPLPSVAISAISAISAGPPRFLRTSPPPTSSLRACAARAARRGEVNAAEATSAFFSPHRIDVHR